MTLDNFLNYVSFFGVCFITQSWCSEKSRDRISLKCYRKMSGKPSDDLHHWEMIQFLTVYWWDVSPFIGLRTNQCGSCQNSILDLMLLLLIKRFQSMKIFLSLIVMLYFSSFVCSAQTTFHRIIWFTKYKCTTYHISISVTVK